MCDGVIYGYAVVSSKNPSLAQQLRELAAFPIENEFIYTDRPSNLESDLPNLTELMKKIEPGDTIVVASLNQLGRNLKEAMKHWSTITKERQSHIVVLDMPLLDTRKTHADVSGLLFADMAFQLVDYVAQMERDAARQRQAEGTADARLRGVFAGRPRLRKPRNYLRVKEAYLSGAISANEAARQLKVSGSTFRRWIKEDSEK